MQSSNHITGLFDADGPLAEVLDDFTVRDEQKAMAAQVHRALMMSERIAIEAGTGTGKTFAYLVPALLSGRHVILSTGTRALQDQLFHRDLPTIAQALGRPVRVALLKGRSNYLCLHRLELAESQAVGRRGPRAAARSLRLIREWATVTRRADISELAQLDEQDAMWPLVTSTRENCLGVECPKFDRCHVAAARREALAADLVVVNHHLLMADLVLKEEGFGDLLPGADAVIVDEAHQLPDVATQFLGTSVSMRQVQSLSRDLSLELLRLSVDPIRAASIVQTLERHAIDAHDVIVSGPEHLQAAQWTSDFVESLHCLIENLRDLADVLKLDVSATATALRARCEDIATRFVSLLDEELQREKATIRWCQVGRHGFTMHSSPVNSADELRELLEAQSCAWVFTSATLAVGDDFTHFQRRLGLDDCKAVRFGSPFDYARQALLYLPEMSAPSSPAHTEEVIRAALPVLKASGGRAFVLFTSHRALRAGADILSDLWPDAPFPILVQGSAPRDALLQTFRAAGNAVLLGTGSFWEGVDVKGTALSVVIIDKLPFAMPEEPLLKARLAAIEDRGGNSFMEEQIPQAVLALKQGVGRLIRHANDFGVIMICDQRLTSRPYGKIFLASLPPMPRTSDLKAVTTFIRGKLADVGINAGNNLATAKLRGAV